MKAIEMRSMRPPVQRPKNPPRRRDVKKNMNPGDQIELREHYVVYGRSMKSCVFRVITTRARPVVKHPGMR